MTDAISLTRTEFIKRYQIEFDKLFAFNVDGECIVRDHVNWERIEFPDMTLSGWSADAETFQRFFNFISGIVLPTRFVFAEVESLEKFTEVWVTLADRLSIDKLWLKSRLPHFRTVCFDESMRWCALFDNFTDKVVVLRAPE